MFAKTKTPPLIERPETPRVHLAKGWAGHTDKQLAAVIPQLAKSMCPFSKAMLIARLQELTCNEGNMPGAAE